jgi:DNA-binding NarL/FixJ family response regulator
VSGHWLTDFGAAAQGKLPRSASSQSRGEALTDRERDVLRLLPSRLTLNEIAREPYVSVNTLKFHLRVIYRKLESTSRGSCRNARSLTRIPPRPSD